jgi:acyl-CoA reductase-like NAD-dependent aldehyde dehydrogenase
VGREVLHAAADRLTPVVLELGGKSPCIVDETAKLHLAARRIVFAKFLNCGQTCVAPDYILCPASRQDALAEALRREIAAQFGADPLANPDYGRIVSEKHYRRILGLIEGQTVVCGGAHEDDALRIAPTVLRDVSWDAPVMGEEIFGPVLPILPYDTLGEAIAAIEARPHPLALYLFSESHAARREVLARCRFGGGCLNDAVVHLATSAMPFGGVGESGMGCYHGRAGFETFSHTRSILDKKTWMDLPVRYQPYTRTKLKLMQRFEK